MWGDPIKNTLRSTLSPDYLYCTIAHGITEVLEYEGFVSTYSAQVLCVILQSQSAGKRKKSRWAPTGRIFRGYPENKWVILLETGSTGPFVFHIHRGCDSPLLTGLAITPPVRICVES